MPYDANGEWFDELPSGYQGGGAEPMPQSQPHPQQQQDYGPTPGYWLMGNAPESTPAPQAEGYGPTPQDWLMPQPIPEPQGLPPMMPQARPPEPGDGYMKFTGQGWVGQDAPGAPQPPPQNMQQAQQGNTFKMEFMNPYTGKSGYLEVPNNKEGEQLYNDYVRRGYQVRFPKQEEQQQQAMQQGMGMPPVNPQEMLAQVQLQPHEQKEFQRLQGLMTTVAKDMAMGNSMGGGTRAMLALKRAIEPYEKRLQMAKQLAMKAAADDAKKKVVLDAEANKAFFEANQPVVRQLPDGSTAVYQLMPDGKYDIQKTKTPNELQQERFKFQQEQADAREKRMREAEEAKAAKVVPFDSVKQRNEAEADAMNEFDKDSRDIYKKGKNAQGEEILTKEYTPEYRKRVAEIFEARKAQHEAGQRANQERMNPGQQGQQGQPNIGPRPASPQDAKKELDAIVAQHKNIANIQDPNMRARAEALYRMVMGGQQ